MTVFVTKILPLYLALISAVAVFVTVGDKLSAKKGGRRVSENTLMMLAALGGSAAMLLIMLLIRHKTRHIKFMLGIPIIILFQAILLVWVFTRAG